MTGTFYSNFSKRKNSTKQPTGGTSVTMTLKEGTSIEKPSFILSGDVFSYNYVQAFGHYYFVDDVKSVRKGITEIDCSMDVLATYKSEIGSYTALIERSDTHYDATYPDPAISVMNDVVTDQASATTSLFSNVGCFVVSVLNNVGSGTGFTTTYIMDKTNLERLAQYVNTDWGSSITPAAGEGAAGILQWLQATFLKTADSIIDCIWLPMPTSTVSGSSSYETVLIGVDSVSGCSGYRLTSPYVASATTSCTIPHYYSSGDFRRSSPYTTGKIYILGLGFAEFNPLDFEPSGTMNIYTAVDVSTGDALVVLSNASGEGVASYTFNVGVSCPVGKVGNDVTGFMGSGLTTSAMVAGALSLPSKFSTAAGIATGASAINTLSSALGTTASIRGGKGGRAMWLNNDDEYIVETFAHMTQSLTSVGTESGRPCMATYQISTCSGFVKCVNANVEIAGMGGEKEEVNNYLNTGFYYE